MRIVIDIDGTISELRKDGQTYADVRINSGAAEKIRQLKKDGHYIILHSARHMKTCEGDVERVKQKVGQITTDWLAKHDIPYNEIHFGKPYAHLYIDDLAHSFAGWDEVNPDDLNNDRVNILIPMAGKGSRFADAGFSLPKPLIDVKGEPMVKWALKSFDFLKKIDKNLVRTIFVINPELEEKHSMTSKLKEIFGDDVHIIIDKEVRGQAWNSLAAKSLINNYNKLFIYNCDTYSLSDIWEKVLADDPDGILSCFKSDHPRYSYAKLDEYGHVIETAEKKVISDNATSGMYYFKRGIDFVRAAEKMIRNNDTLNGEFYVAPCYNELIKNGKKIKICLTNTNWVFGTPEELEDFNKNYPG